MPQHGDPAQFSVQYEIQSTEQNLSWGEVVFSVGGKSTRRSAYSNVSDVCADCDFLLSTKGKREQPILIQADPSVAYLAISDFIAYGKMTELIRATDLPEERIGLLHAFPKCDGPIAADWHYGFFLECSSYDRLIWSIGTEQIVHDQILPKSYYYDVLQEFVDDYPKQIPGQVDV